MPQDDSIPPPHVLRRIAAAADADPRTVARYLRGERVRVGSVAERIACAVADAGLARLPASRRAKSTSPSRTTK